MGQKNVGIQCELGLVTFVPKSVVANDSLELLLESFDLIRLISCQVMHVPADMHREDIGTTYRTAKTAKAASECRVISWLLVSGTHLAFT
jgi:hypothetical protein